MTSVREQDPAPMREAMVAELRQLNAITTDRVAAAFAAVPRHLFAGDEPLERVYHPDMPLVTKTATDGAAISSLSAAHIQAVMLEQAEIQPGMRVLEVGSGGYNVRHGKSTNGGPAKRRTVLTVPEMDWIVPVLNHWLDEVRPMLVPGQHPALWVTERCSRVSLRAINDAFDTARRDAGLPDDLDLHSLRHSYVTHLVEFDYPERFVSDQVGHAYASTTAIYTGVSDEYRNRLVQRALRRRHNDLWDDK